MLQLPILRHAAENIGRLARVVDWRSVLAPNQAGDQRPVSDSAGAIASSQYDLGANSRIEYGMIVDAIMGARCYRVLPDGGGPPIDCSMGMSGPVAPIGAYDASTLVVGSHVRYMTLPNSAAGVILGTEPMYMWDPTKCFGDIVSQGSNACLKTETGPQEAFNMGGSTYSGTLSTHGGITDWSGRSPYDSIEAGEFNRTSELGLMLHLDSYMGFLRADEYTGVWVFYWDGLCRIAGQQFQEWAGPSEKEVYDDEGETTYYQGVSTYPWEHHGMLTAPSDITTELTADESQNAYPYYARYEPTDDDLQPFHRFRTYAGYLGQGEKKLVCAPVYSGGATSHLYSNSTYEPFGLHEQQIMMSGHWGMRTALGFTLTKRPIIPVPKRIEIVTSADGDTPSNYRASGYYGGAGDPHNVQPSTTPDAGVAVDELHLYRAATVMDLHAHLFNWEGENAFYYHGNDYYLIDESSYTHVDTNQEVPTWSDLDSVGQWYLDVPASNEVQYDHRIGGSAKVYHNTAYFTITDEGGVCIGDGWGSELKMAGGSIFLECPGDVFMAPGRNLIAWGGRDICLRAWNSVDITASERDVRIKAEENLNLLGANGGGSYGVFIETRSDVGTDGAGGSGDGTTGESYYGWDVVGESARHTGIVLKAKNSEIIGWGRNVYLMTKMDDCLGKDTGFSGAIPDQPKAGDIVLDAKGEGDVITRTKFVKHWVQCAVMHAFPDEPGINQVNFFTEDGATLCKDVYIDGDLLNYGSHLVKNDVISCEGHYYSNQGGMVAKIDTASTCTAINEGHAYEAELRVWSDARWAIDLNTMWYAEGRPGNPDVVKSAWFDLRIESNYKSQEFTLWEARWQQMARENGDTPKRWTENSVDSNSEVATLADTYPFPGYERLTVDYAYKTVDNLLYDTVTGKAVDRGAAYESPVTSATPAAAIIDGTYFHIGK